MRKKEEAEPAPSQTYSQSLLFLCVVTIHHQQEKLIHGSKKVSLEVLVQIAGSLRVSVDQMLAGPSSNRDNTVNGDWDKLLADCQEGERRVIFETVSALKEALRRRGK